jgi:hypothetical protein
MQVNTVRMTCFLLFAGVMATTAVATEEVAVYEHVLYPQGLPLRHNAIAEVDEKPEFVLAAEAAIPETNRHVVVYAERLSRDLPFDKIYSVYVAVVDDFDGSMRVLDRRNVTDEIGLFTEFPGNFFELRALVSPLPTPRSVTAVELWARLHGTGGITEAKHLLYAITEEGQMKDLLEIADTYVSGNSGGVKESSIGALFVDTKPDGIGDLLVQTRDVTWRVADGEVAPQCGPVSISRYRFEGTKFEKAEAHGLPDKAIPLPGLELNQIQACAFAPEPAPVDSPTR